jgi:hypothetical protein
MVPGLVVVARAGDLTIVQQFLTMLAAGAFILLHVWLAIFIATLISRRGTVGSALWCGAVVIAVIVAAIYLFIPIYNAPVL